MTTDLPKVCAEYLELLNDALDERRVPVSGHPEQCELCRCATAAFSTPPRVVVPSGFAIRVTRAAVRDRLRQRTLVWAGRVAIAASLMLGIGLTLRPKPAAEVVVRPEPVAPLNTTFRDAGAALVSLTVKTTDETIAPAKTLFAPPPLPPVRPPVPESVPNIPDSAKASLEPFADTARRAVNLFVRDVGGAAGVRKVKS
jgi:hypothetical protein